MARIAFRLICLFLFFPLFFLEKIQSDEGPQHLVSEVRKLHIDLSDDVSDNKEMGHIPGQEIKNSVLDYDLTPVEWTFSHHPKKNPELEKSLKIKQKSKFTSSYIDHGENDTNSFFDYTSSEIKKNIPHEKHQFSFVFFRDQFKYSRNGDDRIFKKTFRDAKKDATGNKVSHFAGMLYLSDSYFMLGSSEFKLGPGMGVGIGLNSGPGYFKDGEKSETSIKLWNIPIDFYLHTEFVLWGSFRLGGSAGPSVLTLVQNRADLEGPDKEKELSQFSPGYFASAYVKLALSSLFFSDFYKMYKNTNVKDFFIVLNMRTHKYVNFKQDDLRVDGISFGAGLSFAF